MRTCARHKTAAAKNNKNRRNICSYCDVRRQPGVTAGVDFRTRLSRMRSSTPMAETLTVVAELVAKPGMEEDLRRELMKIVEPTRNEDGCIQYDLHVSA